MHSLKPHMAPRSTSRGEGQLCQLLGVLAELPLIKEATLTKVKCIPGAGSCLMSSGWVGGIYKDPAPSLDDWERPPSSRVPCECWGQLRSLLCCNSSSS